MCTDRYAASYGLYGFCFVRTVRIPPLVLPPVLPGSGCVAGAALGSRRVSIMIDVSANRISVQWRPVVCRSEGADRIRGSLPPRAQQRQRPVLWHHMRIRWAACLQPITTQSDGYTNSHTDRPSVSQPCAVNN